ncbi:MAG: cytochrome c-type biogenesis protein CcmH, partial [Betaproteobacteria bacterium]|nr:cytochrome c-type biogenesis protein CcmH [Betaproteobacteria bacterium]
ARYGDFVLYKPPVDSKTSLLWFGPFALLLGGAALLVVMARRRKVVAAAAPLNAEESERAARLLKEE